MILPQRLSDSSKQKILFRPGLHVPRTRWRRAYDALTTPP